MENHLSQQGTQPATKRWCPARRHTNKPNLVKQSWDPLLWDHTLLEHANWWYNTSAASFIRSHTSTDTTTQTQYMPDDDGLSHICRSDGMAFIKFLKLHKTNRRIGRCTTPRDWVHVATLPQRGDWLKQIQTTPFFYYKDPISKGRDWLNGFQSFFFGCK